MITVDPNQVMQSYAQTIVYLVAIGLFLSAMSGIVGFSKYMYQRKRY